MIYHYKTQFMEFTAHVVAELLTSAEALSWILYKIDYVTLNNDVYVVIIWRHDRDTWNALGDCHICKEFQTSNEYYLNINAIFELGS